jgi:spore maturation protein CgeB
VRAVFLGLSVTSAWGNGHATNYRALVSAMLERGHEVLFLERDQPWYASARDFDAPWIELYQQVDDLERWSEEVADADLVLIGSYVPEGCDVAEWVLDRAKGVSAFWDIDTPVTAAKLARGDNEYLSPELVPRFDLYLSFTGGPLLEQLGARRAHAFYCMADPMVYRPLDLPSRWQVGYLGTYSEDRQQKVEGLLLEPARRLPLERFAIAGAGYPASIDWPPNLTHIGSVPPSEHAKFYGSQRFALNVTRAEMVRAGWSPSVRLFEAAACAVPIISDCWEGIDMFFEPGREILLAEDAQDVLGHLRLDDDSRKEIGRRARARVLAEHTPARRVEELEGYVLDLVAEPRR